MQQLANIKELDLAALSVALALISATVIMATSFSKIAIVFALLKNAMGIQQVPSNMVTNALALVVTAYIMAPVALEIGDRLKAAPEAGKGRYEFVLDAAIGPISQFMAKHVDPHEQDRLIATAQKVWPKQYADSAKPGDFFILVPAFAISEISAAFKIGFILYLAFVAVDLIVANVLMAMGMIMFSPIVVSIPLKIILFVIADGWPRLVQSLILSYQ